MPSSTREHANAALKTALRAPLREISGFLTPGGIVAPWSLAEWDRASDSDEIFWLSSVYKSDKRPVKYSFSTQLETAALFALVARVDLVLWKEIVHDAWVHDWDWIEWADFVATRTALFTGMEVIVLYDVGEDMVTISETVVAWLRGPQSDAYWRFRELIAEASGLPPSKLPVIPLRLTVGDENCERIPRQLRRVCEILATQPEASAPVRLTHFTSGTREVTMEAGEIGALMSLRSSGVRVTDLPFASIRSVEQLTRQQCLEHVRDILDVAPSSASTVEARPPPRTRCGNVASRQAPLAGVERISLSSSLPDELVPGVFSAIRASTSLRAVEIDLEEESRPRASVLQWLAFAVFSRKPLAQLIISNGSQLQMTDVDVMRQIVTAQNPLAVLFPEEAVPDERRVAAAPTTFLSNPEDIVNSAQWTQSPPTSLEIIGAPRMGFIPVLLPGWGKAWVSEAATTKTTTSNHHPDARALYSPTQLIIQSGEGTPELLAFVRLFSTGVKQIKISNLDCSNEPLGEFCREVLIACPYLEELVVTDGSLENFQFIVDAFEANECPALTKLTQKNIELDTTSGINAIMHALSDPTNAMTMQLQKLVVSINSVDGIEPATPERTRDMLQCNSTLRDFELSFDEGIYLEQCRVDFSKFNKSELLQIPVPLSGRCICAFLSAVPSNRALQQLDSLVIRQILGYASASRARPVRVSFGSSNF